MIVDKNSAIDDIVTESIEEIANVFFSEQQSAINKVINGEHEDSIVDMGIPYGVFTTMIEEAYGVKEEDFLDNIDNFRYVSIVIDSMKNREVFCIDKVSVNVDPYGFVVILFDMENITTD